MQCKILKYWGIIKVNIKQIINMVNSTIKVKVIESELSLVKFLIRFTNKIISPLKNQILNVFF